MAIRLTTLEIARIDGDRELLDQIATADIIAVEHRSSRERLALWQRPLEEVEARGLPIKINVLTFEYSTRRELAQFQAIVDRIKASDGRNDFQNDPPRRDAEVRASNS